MLRLLEVVVGIAVPLASFVTGLRSTDPLWLWKRPPLLLRSLLAILVVVPVVAAILVEVLDPEDIVVRSGIMVSILAVGVGPPDLLKRTKHAKDVVCYELGLNFSLMILAVLYMPLAVAIHGLVFHHAQFLHWPAVARVVLLQSIIPFFAGVAVARWLPKIAAPLDRQAPRIVNIAMAAVGVAVLLAAGRILIHLSVASWLSCAAIAAAAILIGHAIGGPTPEKRIVLADFSAIRYPALALLLTSTVPDGRGRILVPVVLAYIIASALMVAAYGVLFRSATKLTMPAQPSRT